MPLHCTQQVSEKRGLSTHSTPIATGEEQLHNTQYTHPQYPLQTVKGIIIFQELTQEIHRRTGISQVPYLNCSCDIFLTLSMSDK